jgi:hypothetical protein
MAIRSAYCKYHPDRRAIGVCVVLKVPICAECSTRYEGVNYSKEGLRILRERRAAQTERGRWRRALTWVALWAAAPVLFGLLCFQYFFVMRCLIDLAQRET